MSRVPSRGLLAAAALSLVLLPSPAFAKDYAETALNVVPSGQYGGVPVPAGADEQARLYDSLTPLFDQVSAADLTRSFKSSRFGTAGAGPTRSEPTPRRGVSLTRDRLNVPHIVGRTRDDVTWAMGWVLQQDRGLLLAQGRYPARLAALEAPNLNAFSLVTGLRTFTPTRQTDRIIVRNGLRAIRSAGVDGRGLLHDVDVFVAGINARLRSERSTQAPFARADLFALNALIGQIFGEGGGGEIRRAELLAGLRGRLGAARARTLFDDLSVQADPDHPSTLTRSFSYLPVPRTPTGNVALDAGSVRLVEPGGATGAAALAALDAAKPAEPPHASNFLMIGADRSTTGHPIFVAGPQIGYSYPGLTLEADVRGPGFQSRGVYSPANPGTMLIGRGEDFAWSLTSAGSDLIDTYAEELCGGSQRRYRYKGRCRTMRRVDAGVIEGVGRVVFDTTVHGPVTAYATSGGKAIALSRKRASYGKDILFQLPFRDATVGRIRSTQTFVKAFARSPYTFNVAYADDTDIAMYSAGRLPTRDPRVDPRLPTRGTGAFEWKGFLSAAGHPQQRNPRQGRLVNWNNRPAPGWGAADNNANYGSAHRVTLLNAQLDRRRRHDPASVTAAMNAAATQDLRSSTLTPSLRALLAGTAPPSPRAGRMLDLLVAWRAGGSSRLDRDLDGRQDAGAAPEIMDVLYPKLFDAVMGTALGPQLAGVKDLVGRDNSPASGFQGGGIAYLDKDLRRLLGTRFAAPFATRFCGGGDRAACQAAVWAAIEAAGVEIAAAQGVPDPDAWRSDANDERIRFLPGLLPTTIRYTNRPSGIQQVMSFSGRRPRRGPTPRPAPARPAPR